MCAPQCYATVRIVRELASVDDAYSALFGLWQLCSWIQTPFDAPTSAIGVEFGAPQTGGGGEMYYLVPGPSGQPVRGPGPDYQRRYDVALIAERLFQINLHRPTGVVAANLWAYTCPEQFDIRTSDTGTSIARFREW